MLEWNYKEVVSLPEVKMDDLNSSKMMELREKYHLDEVVAGVQSDYEKLKRLMKWVHDRWKHNGNNEPSREDPLTMLEEASTGKNFRCVEYAIVTAAVARSMSFPSRVLGLMRKDVETATSGAGHVAVEVWMDEYEKWVFLDPQWDVIPELDGIPLNVVEFQAAITDNGSRLKLIGSSGTEKGVYLKWIAPYLYYFNYRVDQRFFTEEEKKSGLKIMLIPKEATPPRVFQRRYPIGEYIGISNPKLFYPDMFSQYQKK
ncbi:transglutaminase-like domain-containing protein [Kosmotoga olearia]|uniref:Transglutaminase domain protein n=1 Tax=Kosmotoga olearia (strain ATCC BAA-1733 / DSM 21960 / TBF 19.5.1) TaxID=521045 RepID=C5CJ29_KOSOT|nr:transglutaminase-like domain-containing protein [Kosmotoga olearia]ACR79945.1 transglutaminase domain protein [Kosmotoga olearia TBF 19.5.1]